MKLLVNHKYEIGNGCGEYVTGTITKINETSDIKNITPI